MGSKFEFSAKIENAGGGGAFIKIPFDVEKTFGGKRVKVLASFNGEPYRGTLVRMGGPCHIIGVRKEIRGKINKVFGDEVSVVLEEDDLPREIELPPDFAEKLTDNDNARTFFDSLSYTHRREYVNWINEAKKEETRLARIEKTITMLLEKKKRN